MNKRNALPLSLLFCLAPFAAAVAQHQLPQSKPVSAADRHAVVQSLADTLQASYVYPDVAKSVSTALLSKDVSGGYATASDSNAFSEALSRDLRELAKDAHLVVRFDPNFHARPGGASSVPSAEELQMIRKDVASSGYGIQRVERLQGNVGYLEIRGFGPADMVGDAFSSAIGILSGTDALVLDLRRNGGGEPDGVAHLLSHFFPSGDSRHLNDIYSRPDDSTRQYWTIPSVTTRYSKPVYVLTSPRTFSGGEECAYDFQTQKRGVIVGEITGGGANPGEPMSLGHGFAAFIPTGRAINPITHRNWEHVGVKPDIEVPAADALKTAHAAILRALIPQKTDPEELDYIKHVLELVEAGTPDQPVYSRRP